MLNSISSRLTITNSLFFSLSSLIFLSPIISVSPALLIVTGSVFCFSLAMDSVKRRNTLKEHIEGLELNLSKVNDEHREKYEALARDFVKVQKALTLLDEKINTNNTAVNMLKMSSSVKGIYNGTKEQQVDERRF